MDYTGDVGSNIARGEIAKSETWKTLLVDRVTAALWCVHWGALSR